MLDLVGMARTSGGKLHLRMKGEEKSEEIEMVYTIVGARVISANDQIRGYKV